MDLDGEELSFKKGRHRFAACDTSATHVLCLHHLGVRLHMQIKTMARAEGDSREPTNEQAVANIYASMRNEINQIYSKITELEMEVSEHSLAINAIKPLDPSRRYYRMIMMK